MYHTRALLFFFILYIIKSNADQMSDIADVAERDSRGRRPDGRCYAHVSDYIDRVGFGNIGRGQFDSKIPSEYWALAHQFADYANGHLNELGFKKLNVNPYDSPRGSIVVVRAGTPGTSHPTAGDIAVSGGNGEFYNGGMMSYGGRETFYDGNDYVLGIFVPNTYNGATPAVDTAAACAACTDCLRKPENARNSRACSSLCKPCNKKCFDCASNQGGTGCLSRCGDATSSSTSPSPVRSTSFTAPAPPPPLPTFSTDIACNSCKDCLGNPKNAYDSRVCAPQCKFCNKKCHDCARWQGGPGCATRCDPPSVATTVATTGCTYCRDCINTPANAYNSRACASLCKSCSEDCYKCAYWQGGTSCVTSNKC